jgi:uncharacterized Zn-binding protein involved in type VI secretion
MPPLARVGDPTGHPGVITGPGVPTVLIGGMPAAVMGDLHTCSWPVPAAPHPPTPMIGSAATVLIGGRPAVCMGDTAGCGAPVVSGAPTVIAG